MTTTERSSASPASEWTCSGCGELIFDLAERRKPCLKCGSITRTVHVALTETMKAEVYLKTHTKHRDGGRKVVREVIEGDDYHRKTGKWNVMRRLIDRAGNWYEEIFHDPDTGEVVHHTAEPLTEHRHQKKG
jgi:hypothetical protein